MKASCLPSLGVFAALALSPFSASANVTRNYGVFPVKVSIELSKVVVNNTGPDTIVKKVLVNNDLINLALGNPLGTKVDTKNIFLAAAAIFEDHGAAPHSKLIVFDKSQVGINQQRAVVATLNDLDFENAYQAHNVGFGFGSATIAALGTAQNGLTSTVVHVSGGGGGAHLHFNDKDKLARPTGLGSIQGRITFVTTDKNNVTTTFSGIITRGTITLSGPPLGSFDETTPQ